MIVPVFRPPSRVDASNVAEFAKIVREHITRHGCMVIDCSEVEWIAASGMLVLEMASYEARITLVNPNPTVHLMAATFGGDLQCRYDRVSSPAPEPDVPQRLLSIHTGGELAS
jgi:anti-anti-sigma regulatory factor